MRFVLQGALLICFLPCCAWCAEIVSVSQDDNTNTEVVPIDDSYADALILDDIEATGKVADHLTSPETFDVRLMRAETVNIHAQGGGRELGDVLSSVVSSYVTDYGSRLQRKGIAFRGAATQDVVVRYEGIVMNALSTASADLAMIPAPLLERADIWGSGAGVVSGGTGGLVELSGSSMIAPVRAVLTAGTLGDFDLFVSGGIPKDWGYITGAAFGDYSLGRFDYFDAQGSHQWREHNAASRVGGELRTEVDLTFARLSALTFFSHIDRQEAGLSEYPARYAQATQSHILSLSRIDLEFLPVSLGHALANWETEVTHRTSQDEYDNPTALIGGNPTYSDYLEHQTSVAVKAAFLVGSWSQTQLQIRYEAQQVTSSHLVSKTMRIQNHARHLTSLALGEQIALAEDRFRLGFHLQMENDFQSQPMFQASLGLTYRPLDWVEIWGSAAWAERRPSFDELYYETEYMRGNPDLRNQRSLQTELGIALNPASWLTFKINAFAYQHHDLIRFIPLSPYLYQARNITDATTHGIDLKMKSQFWRGLAIDFKYAWVHAVTGSGQLLPTTPEHHLQATLSWNEGIWHAAIWVDYTSKMPRNMAGTSFAPPKLRLNLDLAIQFYPGWRLSLALNNLLNDKTAQDALQRPLPGCHAFLGLAYQFQE